MNLILINDFAKELSRARELVRDNRLRKAKLEIENFLTNLEKKLKRKVFTNCHLRAEALELQGKVLILTGDLKLGRTKLRQSKRIYNKHQKECSNVKAIDNLLRLPDLKEHLQFLLIYPVNAFNVKRSKYSPIKNHKSRKLNKQGWTSFPWLLPAD